MLNRRLLRLALFAFLAVAPALGAGPSFHPDERFTGSSLTGWHTVGEADWRAENGELIGKPREGGGGWLMLDRSYQDIGFYAEFRCTGGCETGVLFRVEKTPNGMKGIYASLTPGAKYYNVTLDAQGKMLERSELPEGGGQTRIAPPPNPDAPYRRFAGYPKYNVKLPFEAPDSSLRADDWNQVEFFFDANILRAFLNDGRETGGVGDAGYGPIALYVGGSGEVRFRQVAYKDLELHVRVPEQTSSNFRKQRIADFYYAWGAAAADFNHDGILDVVSGPYIYFGPDYAKRREVYLGQTANPSTEYANEDWMEFAADFTGDGWADVLTCNFTRPNGCFLYVNPKGKNRRWDKHQVVSGFQTEIAIVRDLNGDGKPALIYGGDGYVRYAKPDPQNPTGTWVVHNVSAQGYETAHGIGVGDINGDGRNDIVTPYGWWEQPPAGASPETWTYHPEVFARFGRGIMGGSEMAVYDVNGDGLNDVVTVLNPHGWGMAWFEQKRDAQGKISFVRHMIMDSFWTRNAGDVIFSEPHGTTFADIDGDGVPDFIVGKRYWSHRDDYLDPDPYGLPVLYWYRTVRNPKAPGGAEFVPELINNRSGAGSNLLAVDLNKDGAVDLVTPTRFGTFIFWGKPHTANAAAQKR
ncbi:MAG TPA: FG-GAP-like repeat-containing protein [Acidobacteriaceae bacterium]|nr:FG-GAP-like repeat-containing protein [Acidobacteriaceae bacterium]